MQFSKCLIAAPDPTQLIATGSKPDTLPFLALLGIERKYM